MFLLIEKCTSITIQKYTKPRMGLKVLNLVRSARMMKNKTQQTPNGVEFYLTMEEMNGYGYLTASQLGGNRIVFLISTHFIRG